MKLSRFFPRAFVAAAVSLVVASSVFAQVTGTAFVRHAPGSFDPDDGLAHGWKTTPRLELFGVEYMGPGRTLSRVDR